MTKEKEEAIETLKENFCAMCAYGSQNMVSCDIKYCDNRDAINALSQEPCEDAIGIVEDLDFVQPKKTVGKLISVDVIDKIRAEIEHEREEAYKMYGHALGFDKVATYNKCIGIIDKYRAESEEI